MKLNVIYEMPCNQLTTASFLLELNYDNKEIVNRLVENSYLLLACLRLFIL